MNDKIIGAIIKLERLNQNKGQKEISHGICVPSYLSKIESGTTHAQSDIVVAIFNRLAISYEHDETKIKEMKLLLDTYMMQLLYGENTEETLILIRTYHNQYLYSELIVEYLLVDAFDTWQLNPLLHKLEENMVEMQHAYYILAKSRDNTIPIKHKQTFVKSVERAFHLIRNSFALNCLCHLCFSISDYTNVLKMENSLIDLAIKEGNTIQLAKYYTLKGSAYGALRNSVLMLECYDRVLHFAKDRMSQSELEGIYYNIAGTYIDDKNYEQGLLYLNKVSEHKDSLRMKTLSLIRSNQKELANECLIRWKQILDLEEVVEFVEVLKYKEACFECEDNYLSNPEYLEVLEQLIAVMNEELHFGKMYFYKDQIISAYEAQRKYKKAMQFQQRLSSQMEKYII